jgi:crotonobetainyl-CoA:carnitine CoA-transferase CaiB-like acyl-CoA transferase
MKSGVLSGYRVLDLSRILAGPWACQMLADFGADVIKVERPGEGDGSRVYGPPFLKTRDGRELDQSPMYLSANRNKKAIAIDISTPQGQQLIRELAAQCDVLVENYKVGDLARYGLDYDSIKAVNPDIVCCSITGFGQTGPYRERLGYDPIFQAMSGLMGATGQPDGAPGGGPMRSGPSISDLIGGLFAAIAILSALLKRERDKDGGEYIDLSLLDCSVAVMTNLAMQYLISGEIPVRRGNGGNGGVPAEAYPCLDGSVYISASTDQQYFRLCDVLGRPDLAQEERYRTQRGRMRHRAELVATVGDLVAKFRLQDLLEGCAKASVPAAPIHNQKEVFEDPQIRARGMQVEIPHPDAGTLSLVANPIRFREHPITHYTAPPAIGEHTRDILSAYLDLDKAEIDALIASGIVAEMPDREPPRQ